MQLFVFFEPECSLHDLPVLFGLTGGFLFEPRLVLEERRENIREQRGIIGCDLSSLIKRFAESVIALHGGNKLVSLKTCAVDAHLLKEFFCVRKAT